MNNEPTILNQEKEPNSKNFETIARELIQDETLLELSGDQRGSVIVDRFIGSIVRHGDVQGSKVSYSPADVLTGMDYMSHTSVNGLREVTNTDGLRNAVRELSNDGDVYQLFGKISPRLSQDEEGKYTLTSPAQIEGYLLAGGDKNQIRNGVGGVDMPGDSWIPVIVEHTQRMAQNPNMHWTTNSEAYGRINSSGPLLKNTGRDWLMANSSAQKAGVDVDLLRRSAETVQRRAKDSHDMGQAALFLATNGRVGDYKKDLDRRSGY